MSLSRVWKQKNKVAQSIIQCLQKHKRIKIIQGDRVEHPDFIKENSLKLDYNYYITHQLQKPVEQIFDLVMSNSEILFGDVLRLHDNKKKNQNQITQFFEVVTKNKNPYQWKNNIQ